MKFLTTSFFCILLVFKANLLLPNLIKPRIPLSRLILSDNDKIIHLSLSSDEQFRIWTHLSDINENFRMKILEKEDKYFYYHFGINPISLLRALTTYLFGDHGPGASTVSMQVARLFYKLKTRSLLGKTKQVFAALYLELILSKDEILEAYLNLIPMGRNIQGIESASLYYFSKPSKKLNELQLQLLLEFPQAPSRFNLIENNPRALSQKIKESSDSYSEQEIFTFLKNLKLNTSRATDAPHFSRYLNSKSNKSVVKTYLNLKHQKKVSEIIKNYVRKNKEKAIFNATTIIVDINTGGIVSYIGSSDFHNKKIFGEVDGIRSKRSPGSTLKPFIYGIAFDQGLAIPQTILYDSPLPYRTPENYDRTFKGPISLEDALITSRNIPAVSLSNLLKNPDLYDFLKLAGIRISHERGHYGTSIALGALEVSPLELVKLYTLLALNGELKDILYEKRVLSPIQKKEKSFLLSPESSIMIKDILGKNARPGFDDLSKYTSTMGKVYWKTGTSFGFKDAWAAGIWGKYAVVTWVGNFKPESNPYFIGSQAAGPLFFEIIDYLKNSEKLSLKDEARHLYNKNLTEVKVCTTTGLLPNGYCPHTKLSLFNPASSPIKKCRVHREITINKLTGLRGCASSERLTSQIYEKRVFEFFNADKLKLYKSFGVKLNMPPLYSPECSELSSQKKRGFSPVIIQPKIGFIYIIKNPDTKARLTLLANADADVEKVSWYRDNLKLGDSLRGDDFIFEFPVGEFMIKVVDDKGRTSQRLLKVQKSSFLRQ